MADPFENKTLDSPGLLDQEIDTPATMEEELESPGYLTEDVDLSGAGAGISGSQQGGSGDGW